MGSGKRWIGQSGNWAASPWRLIAVFGLLSTAHGLPARAQDDVVELLRYQRAEARAAELMGGLPGRLPARSPAYLAPASVWMLWHDRVVARRQAAADTAAAAHLRAVADSLARLPVRLDSIRWVKVEANAQGAFLEQNGETFWHAVPASAALDSVATPRLRALLNGLFGAPTRNAAAAEQEGYAGSEYVQFEYWLVANDSIPMLVLDRDGPFGRGLLLAGSEAHRRYGPLLAADLAVRLAGARATPYADYYHAFDRRQWYRTGFDGAAYYAEETRPPRWAGSRSRNERWRIFR